MDFCEHSNDLSSSMKCDEAGLCSMELKQHYYLPMLRRVPLQRAVAEIYCGGRM
jgi:hypothetical protein